MYLYRFGKIEEALTEEQFNALRIKNLRGDFTHVENIPTPPEALGQMEAIKSRKVKEEKAGNEAA